MKENSFSLLIHVDPGTYLWDMKEQQIKIKNLIAKTLNDRYGGYMIFDIEEVKE